MASSAVSPISASARVSVRAVSFMEEAAAGVALAAAPRTNLEPEIPVQRVAIGGREGAPGDGVSPVRQVRREDHDQGMIILGGDSRADPGNRVTRGVEYLRRV